VDQDHLVDNIVDSLANANKEIQQRMVEVYPRPTSSLAGVYWVDWSHSRSYL